ncbi:conserved Plasmodium protein, unknown function [Plasmodium gallinaceum]|uniref:Uncharacterized protein n=1 Tax=Plasmodium gallinaceum TaxID=5849 RepID=A0A1J1GRL3_PLAGA|nr:conserved Plasmodium protein, unknown function [Plasmodium gallinaceum]CRG93674.1 conserved Plasmodium protein, unknown function [Plasmodium gallinaceum]
MHITMFKFLYNIDLAKIKFFNQLNNELINQNKKNDSFFLEEKQNMNYDLVSDRDIIFEKNELKKDENNKIKNEKYDNIYDNEKCEDIYENNKIKNEKYDNINDNEKCENIYENNKIKNEKYDNIYDNEKCEDIYENNKIKNEKYDNKYDFKKNYNSELYSLNYTKNNENVLIKNNETSISLINEHNINIKGNYKSINLKDKKEEDNISNNNNNNNNNNIIYKNDKCEMMNNILKNEKEKKNDEVIFSNEELKEKNKDHLIPFCSQQKYKKEKKKENINQENENNEKEKIEEINKNINNEFNYNKKKNNLSKEYEYSIDSTYVDNNENENENNKNNQVSLILNEKNKNLIDHTNNDFGNLTNKIIITKEKKNTEKNNILNDNNQKLYKLYNDDSKNDNEKEERKKKEISVETDFFLKKNYVNEFEENVIKNISYNLINEEYNNILENIITLKKQYDNSNYSNVNSLKIYIQKLLKLFIGDINDLFNNIIYCNNDLKNVKYINDLKEKYLEEINDLKKKEKMLRDANERQTNQLLQLSGQISHFRNDSENYDNNYLNEKLENLELEIKKLKDEKQKLHNFLEDKMIYMKKNYELKCYIKSLESVINKKSLLCISLKSEKKLLTDKLKKYYEYLQLTKEDVIIYKKIFYDIKKGEKKIKEELKMLLRNYNNKLNLKNNKEKKKIRKLFKHKKVKLKYIRLLNKKDEKATLNNDKTFSKYTNKNISNSDNNKKLLSDSKGEILLKDDINLIENHKKLNSESNLINYDKFIITNNDSPLLDKKNKKSEILTNDEENNITFKKENLINYDNNEKLENKINYYKLLLDEYESFSIKRKNSTDIKLKEMKKLLLQEIQENEMMQKKYQCLLDKFQDTKKVDNLLNNEINESYENIKIKELLSEINVLTEEIGRLREDQLLLQEDVNNKSKIISHLIKKHALNEEHFRLDKSFSIFNNKLKYEEMKKIMEETLIENIRLRTDLMTLAKSVKEKK